MVAVDYRSPSPVGAYSQVAVSNAQKLAYVAGQLSVDASGEIVGTDDFSLQFETVMSNLGNVLQDVGSDWRSILKFTTYLVDSRLIDKFYNVRRELFPRFFGDQLYPPNTLLVVDRLVREDFLIEIEAVAAVPD